MTPDYKNIESYYGEPGNPSNLTRITPPFPMYLSWDLDVQVRSITCHKLVADSLEGALKEILFSYGADDIERLGIDIYGGCLNVRKMRGGNKWSTHAWGVAIDLNPIENKLKWKSDRALFAKPEFKDMIDIFEKWDWYSLGRKKDYDWMHFQKVMI